MTVGRLTSWNPFASMTTPPPWITIHCHGTHPMSPTHISRYLGVDKKVKPTKPEILLSLIAVLLVAAVLCLLIRPRNEAAIKSFASNIDITRKVAPNLSVAAFDPSGKFVAVGRMVGNASDEEPYEISLWDARDKRTFWSKRTDLALSLVFSPDGKTLASGSSRGVALWRLDDGSLMSVLDSGEKQDAAVANKQVIQLAFSHDGKLVAAAGSFKLWVWKMPEAALFKTISLSECGTMKSLAFSNDGNTLAVGCGEFNRAEIPDPSRYPILLFDLKNLSLSRKLEGHTSEVSCLDFSPDSQILVSGGGRSNTELRLWNVRRGSLIGERRIADPNKAYSRIHSVVFSPDGKMVAFGGSDNKLSLLNVVDGTTARTFEGDGSAILGIAFSQKGRLITTISRKGAIQTWRISTNQKINYGYDNSGPPQLAHRNQLHVRTPIPRTR